MARLSRIVIPDVPHHVTLRGNRRQKPFTQPGDYALDRDLLAERCKTNGVACWAYCLPPNHVHLILTPKTIDDALATVRPVLALAPRFRDLLEISPKPKARLG